MHEVESNVPENSPPRATLQEIATDAIRFWEPRRIAYNAVLACVVIGYFIAYWPESKAAVTFDRVLSLIVLAVLANVCYCAAYVVDIFAQFSDFRTLWLRLRWLLFAIGLTFAAILTRFCALGFLADFIAD